MKTKTEIIIRILMVLILISLCIAVYINGKDLTCDKCRVCFKTTRQSLSGGTYNEFCHNLTYMFEKFNEGYCTVSYSKEGGFADLNKRWK